MKIWSVFSLVIIFHFVIIGLLFVQPGCQSKPADSPDPAITAPPARAAYVEPSQPQELDPAFNSGVGLTQPTGGRQLSNPQRPTTVQRSTPDTGLLEPVRDPVTDSFSLPPVEGSYTVAKGDTLSGIARKQGTSLTDLLSANGLSKGSTIYVGQTLLIPAASQASSSPSMETSSSSREVVVGRGDTLSAIAARNGTTVKSLKSMNRLSGDTIYVGQKLLVPGGGNSSIGAPSSAVGSATRSQTQNRSLSSSTTTYVVKAGDTPSGIARRFGLSSRELMAANGITDPRKLFVGRELSVPQTQTSTVDQQTLVSTPSQSPPPSTSALRAPSRPTATPQTTTTSGGDRVEDDPMAALEALEDEDLPFVEVEVMEEDAQPAN